MDQVKLKNRSIALFFSYRLSIKTLQDFGIFNRESKIWHALEEEFNPVYIVTYGRKEETNFTDNSFKNLKLLNNKWPLNPFIYSLLLPFLYKKELSGVSTYKTNQLSGSLPALFCKFLYNKKFILREGFSLSILLRKTGVRKIKIFLVTILERASYFFADKIIVSTSIAKDYLIRHYKVDPSKISIIPNGIDLQLFNHVREIKRERGRILFVGRLSKEKNLFALLEAIRGIGSIHLIIIGQGYLKDKLIRRVREQKLKVTFLDTIHNDNLFIEYNKAEIFVLPSLSEGNPKVLLEAMACQTLVMGSNIPGINNIIKNRINGLLFDPTPESIRGSILEVLNNRSLLASLTTNARMDIEGNFDLNKVIRKEVKAVLS